MRIAQDIPCGRCRYNLRSLSRFGACPECGLPVSASLARLETRRFKIARRLLLAALVVHVVLAGGAFLGPAAAQGLWPYLFLSSGSLALAGFAWSAASASARYSVSIFLGTLAYVCLAAGSLVMTLLVIPSA